MTVSNQEVVSTTIPAGTIHSVREWLQLVVVLFKLRVVSLLVLAAIGGAFLGAGGRPGLSQLLLVIITGTMAASGAAALNQYLERHSDYSMSRTRTRPLVSGSISRPGWVIAIGLILIGLPVLAVLPGNAPLAFYLLLGAFIYVGIYTLWLKPRTLLNIVIGGAAGSAAVMSGGAAVGAAQEPAVIVLALLVFLWTPSHFWSLAILYRDDYQKADFPMLPAQMTSGAAGYWVLLHTLATGFAALSLLISPALGWLYFIPVTILTIEMIRRNLALIHTPSPIHARSLFIASNIYLMVILLAICLDTFMG